MADTLRVYREAIQTRDILPRKINKLQSMRRELDISLSEPSAVTSISMQMKIQFGTKFGMVDDVPSRRIRIHQI